MIRNTELFYSILLLLYYILKYVYRRIVIFVCLNTIYPSTLLSRGINCESAWKFRRLFIIKLISHSIILNTLRNVMDANLAFHCIYCSIELNKRNNTFSIIFWGFSIVDSHISFTKCTVLGYK